MVCSYAIGLRAYYAMSGTFIGRSAVVLTYAMLGTAIRHIGVCMQCPVLVQRWRICLCARYARPGTDLAYAFVPGVLVRYPFKDHNPPPMHCATHLLCGVLYRGGLCCYAFAMQCPVLKWAMLLRICYAVSGTERGYAATGATDAVLCQHPSLSPGMALRDVRY
eukprot:3205386-Rhodomonas_salina.4